MTHGISDKIEHGLWAVYVEVLPDDVGRIVEIGVLNGDSLRLWASEFPTALVVGVDIADRPDDLENRYFWLQCDQTAPELGGLCQCADVIVDDASHVGELTLRTWRNIWPHMKSGARYFIEDWTPWIIPDMTQAVDIIEQQVLAEGGTITRWLDEAGGVAKDASLAMFVKP
jgi:hypothetical protein